MEGARGPDGTRARVNLLLLLLPLLLLGFTAGALRAWAALPTHPPRRRRLLQFGWVALLLFGAPAWLVAAALLRLW
jgi:hypothetical protein